MNGAEIIVVRDRRRPGYYTADNLIVKHYLPVIGDKGFTLYSILCCLAVDKIERSSAPYSALAEHTGWSKSTIWAYRRLLEIVELIEVEQGVGRQRNLYYLLDVVPLDVARVDTIRERVVGEFRNGFQRQVLERLDGWKPWADRLAIRPKRTIKIAGQDEEQVPLWFHSETIARDGETIARDGETIARDGETIARDGETLWFHGETTTPPITRTNKQEPKPKNQKDNSNNGAGKIDAAIASALLFAGIIEGQHRAICEQWRTETGEELTAQVVLLWAQYVMEANIGREKRNQLRPGFIVDQLRRGNHAPAPQVVDDFHFDYVE